MRKKKKKKSPSKVLSISLIIPVYNVRNYLDECFSSILQQGVDHLEVILVDDGSTDDSGAFCDAWASDKPFVKVIHQTNGGLSAARNNGLDHATGDLIAFMDSDDHLGENTLRDNLCYFQEDPNLDLVEFPVCEHEGSPYEHLLTFHPRRVCDPLSSAYSSRKAKLSKKKAKAHAVFTDWIRHKGYSHCYVWNKLYRASLWKDCRFPVGQVFEDTAVMPDIMLHCQSALYSDQGCYHYLNRPNSISHTWRYRECRQLFLNQKSLYEKALATPSLKRSKRLLHPLRKSMVARLVDMGRCLDCNKIDHARLLADMTFLERLQCRIQLIVLPPIIR